MAGKAVLGSLHQAVAQRQNVTLQGHEIGIWFAVNHHHFHGKTAKSPPRLGAQQGIDQRQSAGRMNTYQQNRPVAGNAETPQLTLVERPGPGSRPRPVNSTLPT